MTRFAVLFDLDGTLVDSSAVSTRAFERAYAECGGVGTAPVGRFLEMAGRALEHILKELGLPLAMGDVFREESRRQAHLVEMFPGMRALLAELTGEGVVVGVITGKDRDRTEHLLTLLGLDELADAVVTPCDPPAPKPAPDGVDWLRDRLGSAAMDTVLVGDSTADMIAGRSAGVHTISCLWGAGTPAQLAATRPCVRAADPEGLRVALKAFTAARRVSHGGECPSVVDESLAGAR